MTFVLFPYRKTNMPPYNSVSDFYKNLFGKKAYKLSIDAGCTCPTRDGTKGWGGCSFCSASGSGDFAASRNLSVTEQINQAKALVKDKCKDGTFIAYFQNFTNTYGNAEELEKKYLEAVRAENVSGIAIATRPDCLSDDILFRIARLAEKTFVQLELGLQTSDEKSAASFRRAFTNEVYEDAVRRIKNASGKIHLVTHLILGLPGENLETMISSAKFAVASGTDGIKLSLLHVLEGTDLALDYKKGLFTCMEKEEYFFVLGEVLKVIPKHIVIHRLTGDGAKRLLIAPLWTADKKRVLNDMKTYFEEHKVKQGELTPDWRGA